MSEPLPEWPFFGYADDVRPALRIARLRGRAAVLATIVDLDGGGPRPVGAQMLITTDGTVGFLSGGCIEADVVAHARACLADGQARRLVYGQGSPWRDIQLLCGARMEVLLEKLSPDDGAVETLLALDARRQPATWLSDGDRRQCHPPGAAPRDAWQGAFAKVYEPAYRLIVVGHDPIALAMVELAARAGFLTSLIRPLGPRDPPPLPGLDYHRGAVTDAMRLLAPDPWTAIAVASHQPDLDREALIAALSSEAFYVGLLGARRRLPDTLAALKAANIPPDALKRLYAPVGLDIAGKAPWEVAISVLAQVTQLRHSRAPPRSADP